MQRTVLQAVRIIWSYLLFAALLCRVAERYRSTVSPVKAQTASGWSVCSGRRRRRRRRKRRRSRLCRVHCCLRLIGLSQHKPKWQIWNYNHICPFPTSALISCLGREVVTVNGQQERRGRWPCWGTVSRFSTLQFTAVDRGRIAQPAQSPQRKCSMKLSSTPLLLYSSSLPVGRMSPRGRPMPNGFLLQIHRENTKRLWSADRTQWALTFVWGDRLKVWKFLGSSVVMNLVFMLYLMF